MTRRSAADRPSPYRSITRDSLLTCSCPITADTVNGLSKVAGRPAPSRRPPRFDFSAISAVQIESASDVLAIAETSEGGRAIKANNSRLGKGFTTLVSADHCHLADLRQATAKAIRDVDLDRVVFVCRLPEVCRNTTAKIRCRERYVCPLFVCPLECVRWVVKTGLVSIWAIVKKGVGVPSSVLCFMFDLGCAVVHRLSFRAYFEYIIPNQMEMSRTFQMPAAWHMHRADRLLRYVEKVAPSTRVEALAETPKRCPTLLLYRVQGMAVQRWRVA